MLLALPAAHNPLLLPPVLPPSCCREDAERFPEVARWLAEAAAAEAALAGLLPGLRRALQGTSAVQYVSLRNVGDYLLEVPVEQAARAPKEWQKARRAGAGSADVVPAPGRSLLCAT